MKRCSRCSRPSTSTRSSACFVSPSRFPPPLTPLVSEMHGVKVVNGDDLEKLKEMLSSLEAELEPSEDEVVEAIHRAKHAFGGRC